MTDEQAVERFEAFVHNQQPAKPWTPCTDYSFETRKAIEGQHPQLIKDVFQPRNVLNVGCGTGFLDGQLRDATIAVEGMDTNPPDGPHFWRQDITDERPIIEWDVPYTNYDLVICREVLEHMTVKDVAKAVHNLVKLSSRYIYVTTRFAKAPDHLLSVDASDDLDPTHITMLSKPFLRTLFVLEGCKSRPDLEARMDWQGRGRCLVFEVA